MSFWENQLQKVKEGKSPALTIEQQQEREKPELAMQENKPVEQAAQTDDGVGFGDVAKAAASGVVGWAESNAEIALTPESRKAVSATVPGMLLGLADYVPVIRDTLVNAKRQTQEQFAETKQGIKTSMSASARKALEAELVNDNLEFTDDATKLSTWIMKGTETIARMVPDLVAGGLVGKELYQSSYDLAFQNGIAKGLTETGAKIAANKIANAAMMAPTAIASTMSAQGSAGVQVRQTIENLPWKDLAQSDTFKQSFAQINADPANAEMSNKEKLNLARTMTAEAASKDIIDDPALLAVNALASFIGDATLGKMIAGKMSGGIASKVIRGAVAEGATEAPQGAMEQYAQNLTLIDIAGQDIAPSKGVAKAFVEGGVMGTVIGGGMGGGSGAIDSFTGRPSEGTPTETIPTEDVAAEADIVPIQEKSVAQRREELEQRLDQQREEARKAQVISGEGEAQQALAAGKVSPTAEELIQAAPSQPKETPMEYGLNRATIMQKEMDEFIQGRKAPTVAERRANLEKRLEQQRAEMDRQRIETGTGEVQARLSRPAEPTAEELILKAPEESGPTPGELEFRRQSERNYIEQVKDAKIPQGLKGKPNAVKMMNLGYRNALSDFGGLSKRMAKTTGPSAEIDTMSDAIAKMGGLSRKAAEEEGFDPAMFKGSKTFSAKGKMTFDDAAESLNELGFTNRESKPLDSNDVVEMLYGEANNAEVHYSNLVNPEMMTGDAQLTRSWAKQLGGADKLNIAVQKALNNEPLGKRQADVVEDMLDTINIMRTEGAEQAKEKLQQTRIERADRRVNEFNTLINDAIGRKDHLQDAQAYADMLNEMPDTYTEEQVILDELVSTAGDIDFASTTEAIDQYEAGSMSLPTLLTKLSDITEKRVKTYAEAKPAIQKISEPTTQPIEGVVTERVAESEGAPAAGRAEVTNIDQRKDGSATTVSDAGLTLLHGSPKSVINIDDVQIVRTGQKQGKKGRLYGGFYATSEEDIEQAKGYAGMSEGTPTIHNVRIKAGTKVLNKIGDITRLSENYINELTSQGYGLVVGKDPRGRTEYVVIDKNAIDSISSMDSVKDKTDLAKQRDRRHAELEVKQAEGLVLETQQKIEQQKATGGRTDILNTHLQRQISGANRIRAKYGLGPMKVETKPATAEVSGAEKAKVVNASSHKTVRDKVLAWADIKFGDTIIDHRGAFIGVAVADFDSKKPRAIKIRKSDGTTELYNFKSILGSDVEVMSIDAIGRIKGREELDSAATVMAESRPEKAPEVGTTLDETTQGTTARAEPVRTGRDEKYGIDVEMTSNNDGSYTIKNSDENSRDLTISSGYGGVYRGKQILNQIGEFVDANEIVQAGTGNVSSENAPYKGTKEETKKAVDLVAEIEFSRETGDMNKVAKLEGDLYNLVTGKKSDFSATETPTENEYNFDEISQIREGMGILALQELGGSMAAKKARDIAGRIWAEMAGGKSYAEVAENERNANAIGMKMFEDAAKKVTGSAIAKDSIAKSTEKLPADDQAKSDLEVISKLDEIIKARIKTNQSEGAKKPSLKGVRGDYLKAGLSNKQIDEALKRTEGYTDISTLESQIKNGQETKKAEVQVDEIVQQPAPEVGETLSTAFDSENIRILNIVNDEVKSGFEPKNNNDLKVIASKVFEVEKASDVSANQLKIIQEAFETVSIVNRRKNINALISVGNGSAGSVKLAYIRAVKEYEAQPNLDVLTGKSSDLQAYSTPTAMALLANLAAGIDSNTSVYEPTAGNGLLLVLANPKFTIANELDPIRASSLAWTGFDVTVNDATANNIGTKVDAILANPPFGPMPKNENGERPTVTFEDYRGKVVNLKEIDHVIARNALEAMKDDGKATLIIGASMNEPGVYKGNKKAFLNWLYSNYNVKHHVEVDGSMYTGQGASFPTQMIVIDGRVRSGTGKFAPIPGIVKRIKGWTELYENFKESGLLSTNGKQFNGQPKGNGVVYPNVTSDTELRGSISKPAIEPRISDLSVKRDREAGLVKSTELGGTGSEPIGKPTTGTIGSQPDISKTGMVGSANILSGDTTTDSTIGQPKPVRLPVTATGEPKGVNNKVAPKQINTKVDKANNFQAHYKTASNGFNEGVLTPNNMASYTQAALADIQTRYGSVDQLVIDKLGYQSADEMHKAFMGLQTDSIALAIDNIENGRAIIIGDQTGVGKGRQAAGIIRYAIQQGKIPVFISQKPNLFTDMYDDLADIGVENFKPLIMNNNNGFVSKGGERLFNHTDSKRSELIKQITSDSLPEGYSGLFLTYSQISSDSKGVKTGVLNRLAKNAIIIMDESHSAAGDSKTGGIFQDLVNQAFGVTYLSATYAKRPDNMMLYMRTDLGLATDNRQSLLDAVTAGGLGMQTYIAGKLAEAGQMVRRERSFDGINIKSRVIEDKGGSTAKSFDKATSVLRTIQDVSAMWANYVETSLADQIQIKHGLDTSVGGNKADKNINITSFSSVVHNNIAQLALGLKARDSARMALEALAQGKSPVIALDNTLGSALQTYMADNGLSVGDNASDLTYASVLRNALEGVLSYSVKEPGSDKSIKFKMPISEIADPSIQAAYKRAIKGIAAMGDENIPGSPIDAIRDEIQKAGKSVAEITGRNVMIDYSNDSKIIARPASEMDRRAVVDRFNNGTLDVLILNQAGSTGLSIHASNKFTNQKPRHMIVVQPSLDINTYMQMLGRTNRTGQIELPSYDNVWLNLPSEKRPAAVLSRKMSSLNANTSGNTESATSVDSVDLLNPYGDQVVKAFVDANMDYLSQFSSKLTSVPDVDAAIYFLGKLAVLPVNVQEEVLGVIESEYKDLITYLDSTGQNELNMTEMDLDAKPLSQLMVSEKKKGAGVFSDPVYLTKVNAKAIGKSPTWAQVNEALAESSQDNFNSAISQAAKDTEYRKRLVTRLEELKQRRGELASSGKDTGSIETSINEQEVRIADFDSSQLEIKNLFGAGGSYAYGSYLNVVLEEDVPAVPAVIVGLDYRHEGGNPYSDSKWKMKLMVADRIAKIDVSLSRAKKGVVQGKRWDSDRTMESRFNLESEKPARENRYVMTGNLVEAQTISNMKGQIKPITLADGRIIQAMVLPRSFDPVDGVSKKLTATPSQVSNWLAKTEKEYALLGISNNDNSVTIRRSLRDESVYVVDMPKSVSKGKMYWANPAIEDVIGKQAVKGSGSLSVSLTESEMKRFVKAMDGISPLAIKNQAQISNFNQMAGKKEKEFESKKIVFSKYNAGGSTPKGVSIKEGQLITQSFLKSYKGAAGIKVTWFKTQAEAMDYLGIDDSSNSTFPAAYDPRRNEVVMIAENMDSVSDIKTTMRHEILTHHGLMKVVGQEEWSNVINLVNQSRQSKDLSSIWAEVDRNYDGLPENAKAEEVIAKISESEPGAFGEWRDRIISAIVRALRNVGLVGDKISKAEIRDMIRVIGERFRTVGRGESRINDDIKFRRNGPNDPWADENKKLREEDRSLWQQGKNILKRNLTPEGLLPNEVFNEKIKRDSEFEAVEFTARVLVGDFDKAIMKAYKMSFDYLPQATKNKLNEALSGRIANDIAPEVKASIIAMRQSIDGLSGEYINNIMDKMANEMAVNGRVSAADEALLTRISDNIGAYVNRSYKAFDDPKWFKKVPVETVNAARDYFVQRYIDDGETESEAKRLSNVVVSDILKNGTAYDSMESFVAEGKLGAKDLSILMRRKVIDPEIRALLGEYDDPRINYVKSATKMGRLVWNERFLNRVLDIGMGSFLFKENDRPANTKQIAGEQSETYSPLNGLWTFPEVEQAFKDSMGREQMSDLMRFIVRANGAVKYGKTVLSPTTAMRNFQSAMFFALANGHFNLSKIKDAMAAVRVQVTGKATAADIGYFVKLKRLGVVYDAPYAKEMARLLGDSEVENMLSSKFGDGAMKSFTKLNDFAQSFYSFGDDFWKIVGFENEKASLLDAGMSVGEAEMEAAKRIRNTYPTYSMTGKAIKWLSRFPLAGTFVSFPAEIIRTSINMIKTANSDIKSSNPKMRALGYKRIAGMAFVSSAFFALNAATKAILGVTDDEEEAIRDLSAPWQKNSTFAYVGRDEKNNLQYFDMSFLDPYGYFKRPITAMLRDQPWQDAAVSALSDLISPFLGADIVAQSIYEVFANKKSSGGQVYNEDGMAGEQLEDISVHLGKTVAPGFIGNAVRTYKALDGQVSSSGKPYKFEEEMLSLVGWRLSTMDPKTSLHYKTFEFSDGLKNANRTIMKQIQDVNKVSDDDLMSAYESAKKQHDNAFKQMIRLTSSAKNSGMTKAAIFETLKRSGVSDDNAKMVIAGKTPPFKLSKASAENAIKKAKVSIGAEHSSRVRERVIKLMKQ